MKISEVNFTPIPPRGGLVGFASCVIDEAFRVGSIAVHVRPNGEYRLVYPVKKVGDAEFGLFYPINKKAGSAIEIAILKKCEEVLRRSDEEYAHDGHGTSGLHL